ncbi:hypothetical protein RUM43_015129 [Polyplax serrata]|uniref:Uncharacterized protein n=1 Tax=Polyplax serrata TaxID=468196 RepID=A0AAN8P0M5_POLSC
MNANLEKLNKFFLCVSKEINNIELRETIIDHFTLLTQLIQILNEEIDLIASSVLLGRHNTLHPRIIIPRALLQRLSDIRLPKDLQLPFPLKFKYASEYFDLAELHAALINDDLMCVVDFPLVPRENYTLYELLPLPVHHNISHILSFIHLDHPYLVMSKSKVNFAELDSLKRCVRQGNTYFCEINLRLSTRNPPCSVILLTTIPKEIPSTCATKTVSSDVEIIQKLADGVWLFSLSQPTLATLNCDKFDPSDFELSNAGILKLNKGSHSINIALDKCCRVANKSGIGNAVPIGKLKMIGTSMNELKAAKFKLTEYNKDLDKLLKQNSRYTIRSRRLRYPQCQEQS